MLGSLMLGNREAIADSAALLSPGDFYESRNQAIYDQILTLYDAGKTVDLQTISNALTQAGTLDKAGGYSRLMELAGRSVSPSACRDYARIVADLARRRRIITLGQEAAHRGHDPTVPTESLVTALDSELARLDAGQAGTYSHIAEVNMELYAGVNATTKGQLPRNLMSGFYDLDHILRGFEPQSLTILASRPSLGKTALALNIAVRVVKAGGRVGIFSLEMSRLELARRFFGIHEGRSIREYEATNADLGPVIDYMTRVARYQFYIDQSSSLTTRTLTGKARKGKSKYKLDLIIVDYLQLVQGDGRTDNREGEISQISRAMKGIAREINTPMLVLSQLSRKTEDRTDRRPMLSDLRESGAIEQDADNVLLIHRPEHYGEKYLDADSKTAPITESPRGWWKGRAEIIVAKHRNGPTGSCYLSFSSELTKFDNIAKPVVYDVPDAPPDPDIPY